MKLWTVALGVLALAGLAVAGRALFPAYPFDLYVLMPWHNPPGPFPVPPVEPVAQFTVLGDELEVSENEYQPYAVVEMIHADGSITYQAAAVYGDANHIIFKAGGGEALKADPVKAAAARKAMLDRLRE